MSVELKEKNGKTYWRMYVCERAILPGGKVKKLQKNLLFDLDKKEVALREEKNWKRKLLRQANNLEGKDLEFQEVLYRFKVQAKAGFVGKGCELQTYLDHVSRVRRYCESWMNHVSSELTKGDGRKILRLAKEEQNASVTQLRKIKASINLVFNWGIEEKLIRGVHLSPVYGLQIEEDNDEEKVPPILSLEQVKKLLAEARKTDHPWYPVWAFALLTGIRSGELFALKWSSVDMEKRIIRVYQSYAWRRKKVKGTKSGYWRNVPISDRLYSLILELQELTGHIENVLPRVSGWEDGYAAKHLRMFLERIGITDFVVFHTLRACFATHMLAAGIEPAKVMSIGGWKDLKTFGIYIRLAGVDVNGLTNALDILPVDQAKTVNADKVFDGVAA